MPTVLFKYGKLVACSLFSIYRVCVVPPSYMYRTLWLLLTSIGIVAKPALPHEKDVKCRSPLSLFLFAPEFDKRETNDDVKCLHFNVSHRFPGTSKGIDNLHESESNFQVIGFFGTSWKNDQIGSPASLFVDLTLTFVCTSNPVGSRE